LALFFNRKSGNKKIGNMKFYKKCIQQTLKHLMVLFFLLSLFVVKAFATDVVDPHSHSENSGSLTALNLQYELIQPLSLPSNLDSN